MIWSMQVTMMKCAARQGNKWDFTRESPTPVDLLARLESGAHPGECSGMVVVTAASSGYFERVRNLVGSIHVWQVYAVM